MVNDIYVINHLTIYRANIAIKRKLYMDYLRYLKIVLNLINMDCTVLLNETLISHLTQF